MITPAISNPSLSGPFSEPIGPIGGQLVLGAWHYPPYRRDRFWRVNSEQEVLALFMYETFNA